MLPEILILAVDFTREFTLRSHGPGRARLILQPTMAALLAVRDGWKDAKAGRPAYLWDVVLHGESRWLRLQEGMKAITIPFLLAIGLDAFFQFVLTGSIHAGAAVVVGVLLIGVPYIAIRGPMNRMGRLYLRRRGREPNSG